MKIKRIFSIIVMVIFAMFCNVAVFAQSLATVDIGDSVYDYLTIAEQKGYCERLPNTRPFSEATIVRLLGQIEDAIDDCPDSKVKTMEKETLKFYQGRYGHKAGFDFNRLSYRIEDSDKDFPISMEISNTSEALVSSGFYSDSSLNSTGYEVFHNLNFTGDFGKDVSYRVTGFIGLTQMDLQQVGSDYLIGHWWYDDFKHPYGAIDDDPATPEEPIKRTINTFRNNNVLPYSYKKKWDGSIYYLTNVTASGLEGWPFVPALGFGMYGEVRTSLFDDRLDIGIGRINREWAAMDTNSSLVFNSNASPFFSFDINVKLFDWLSFSTLTGVLEFPNCVYINKNAWNLDDPYYNLLIDSNVVDSYYFQNAYSIGLFNFDFNNLHIDFGSSCVWPKRFELGYMFPIIDRVIYQNSVGDFDNLALFGDLKYSKPGIGSAWFSLFLDEINSPSARFWEKTRCMYAWQSGAKANLPWLPNATLSFRYTKVEPYCYTHQAITKQPWYDYYISEAYMNNGKNIGYYLDPNSDEFFVKLESMPLPAASFGLQYQLVRHGADYGSGAVPGSSIWSELPIGNRDVFYKHFLHDGTYEWTNVLQLQASYNFNRAKLPFQLSASVGYVYDYFTQSAGSPTDPKGYPYSKINTSEYPVKQGFVASLSCKVFGFDHCQ